MESRILNKMSAKSVVNEAVASGKSEQGKFQLLYKIKFFCSICVAQLSITFFSGKSVGLHLCEEPH